MPAATALRERSRPSSWPLPDVDPADLELLARVLEDGGGEDALVLATMVLYGCGGLRQLGSLSRSQLVEAGLSMSQVARLKSALALGARVAATPSPGRELDRAAVVSLLRPVFAPLDREELHVVHLGADGTFRGRQRLAEGGYTALVVHAREVLSPALEARADAIVLAHNHPSGRPEPSPEDVSFTSRVEAACGVVGLRLVDHLVFGRDEVASAMPNGPCWPRNGPRRVV